MKTLKWTDIIVNMPAVGDATNTNNAGWWANYLLELGDKGDYNLLMHYLDEARKGGCLGIIRLTTQQMVQGRVRERMKITASLPGVKKARRKSVSNFKAVA